MSSHNILEVENSEMFETSSRVQGSLSNIAELSDYWVQLLAERVLSVT